MKVYTLKRRQTINAGISEVWDFFSSAANLQKITPPYMNFRIISPARLDKIHKGQLISYKVSPILGIPLSWTTEIADVKEHSFFVDVQLKGPYKLWNHEHHFTMKDGMVHMYDIVKYAMPFSLLGRLVHALLVKKQLDNIFDYRYQKINELFGEAK